MCFIFWMFCDSTDCSVTVYSGLHVQSLCGLYHESPASSKKVRSSSGTNKVSRKVSNGKMERNSQKVRRPLPKKRALQAMWAAESCRTMMRLKWRCRHRRLYELLWHSLSGNVLLWSESQQPIFSTLKDGNAYFICHTRNVGEAMFASWQPAFEVIGTPSDFVQSFNVAQLNLFRFNSSNALKIWGFSVRWLKQFAELAKVGSGWQTVSGPDNALRINPYWENSSLLRIDQLLRCNCLTILMLFPLCIRHSICMHLESQVFEHVFESRLCWKDEDRVKRLLSSDLVADGVAV
jgi:hypothetical protein